MGTLLAVLSKENGALLPLLLLVVEAFLHRMRASAPPRKLWLALVLGIYLVALTHYAVLYGKSPVGLPHELRRADGTPATAPSPELARRMTYSSGP